MTTNAAVLSTQQQQQQQDILMELAELRSRFDTYENTLHNLAESIKQLQRRRQRLASTADKNDNDDDDDDNISTTKDDNEIRNLGLFRLAEDTKTTDTTTTTTSNNNNHNYYIMIRKEQNWRLAVHRAYIKRNLRCIHKWKNVPADINLGMGFKLNNRKLYWQGRNKLIKFGYTLPAAQRTEEYIINSIDIVLKQPIQNK